MSSPSPFDIGRQIGTNFHNVRKETKDENAIESILSQAMSSADPKILQNSIGKILSQVSPERQQLAVQYLQNAYQNVERKNEQLRQEQLQKQEISRLENLQNQDFQRKEDIQRKAAQEAGYTFGAPPQVQAQQLKNLQPKENLQQQKLLENDNILRNLEKRHGVEEGSYAAYRSNPELAERLGRPTEKKLSPYETNLQKSYADERIKLEQELPKLKGTIDTINRMKEETKKLTGVSGYIKGYLGSETAANFDATGLTLIEPIVKIFNPVGAIPIAKIELVKDKFAPKSTDTVRTINGKLKALESFTNQAISRANGRLKIIQESNGNPDSNLISQYDQETQSLVDAMQSYDLPKESQQAIPQGNVKVKNPEGKEGYMSKESFEKAKKQGLKYELVE